MFLFMGLSLLSLNFRLFFMPFCRWNFMLLMILSSRLLMLLLWIKNLFLSFCDFWLSWRMHLRYFLFFSLVNFALSFLILLMILLMSSLFWFFLWHFSCLMFFVFNMRSLFSLSCLFLMLFFHFSRHNWCFFLRRILDSRFIFRLFYRLF